MKHFIVVSALGKDRPGLVNRITHAINDLGGNIELQRSTRMAAEFAMLVLFSLEQGSPKDAIARLNSICSNDLFINARSALSKEAERPANARTFELIASGADQPGIIDVVTLILFKHNINIEPGAAMDRFRKRQSTLVSIRFGLV